MLALWRAVRREVVLRGARSIEAACRAIVARGGIDLQDESGARVGAYRNYRTLSKWYHEVERARAQPLNFPTLALRMEQIEADLIRAAAVLKKQRVEFSGNT